MHRAEPALSTRRDGDGITVTARYETPEGLRMVRSLQTATAVALSALGIVAAGLVLDSHPAGLDGARRAVLFFVAAAGVVGSAFKVAAMLADRRFGLRPITDHSFTVGLSREAVSFQGRSFSRGSRIAFTAEPHRFARDEDRTKRTDGTPLHDTYRRASEIKLQHGEAFVVLAAVSDEEGANAIVRRLQSADDEAARGSGAFSKGTVFGPRQQPE